MARKKVDKRMRIAQFQKSNTSVNMPQETLEKIQKKAYELFEKRGYSHGNDLADWLEAERIVWSQK